jgi:hypothetical protein
LERSDPQRWGRYGRVEVTGANGGAVAVDVTSLEEKVKKVIGRSQGEGVK